MTTKPRGWWRVWYTNGAFDYFKIMSSEQPASRPVVVTAVTELGAPKSETNGVIVDKAPASESRAG